VEWGILGLIALLIGIAAGIVQVLDYLEKRRRKPQELPPPLPPRPEIPHNLPQPGEFIGGKPSADGERINGWGGRGIRLSAAPQAIR